MKNILTFILLLPSLATFAQTWEVTTISNDGIKPILAIDDLDRVHIVYMTEETQGWVKYAMIDGSSVTGSMVSTGYFYGPPDITYDQNNDPVIAYHDHDTEDQAVFLFDNGQWLDRTTHDDGHDGWDNSILVDANGNIHSSSVNPFGGPGIEYGLFDGTDWTVQQIGSGAIMYANATSIALDSDGKVYISYFNDQTELLQLANNVSGAWQIETPDPAVKSGRFSAMLIDAADNIHISYYAEDGFVKLASRINNEWMLQTIDQLQNVEIGFSGARNITSIQEYQGIMAIAYGDKSVVKLATIDASGVQIETVVERTDQDFGQIVSLDFTSEGVPYIGFSGSNGNNNPNGNIFVAHRTGMSTVTSQFKKSGLEVYPNPVEAGKILVVSSDLDDHEFAIYDLRGRTIKTGEIQQANILIPASMTAGNYIVEVHGRKNHYSTLVEIVHP